MILPKIEPSVNIKNQVPAKFLNEVAKLSEKPLQMSMPLVSMISSEDSTATMPMCHPLKIR